MKTWLALPILFILSRHNTLEYIGAAPWKNTSFKRSLSLSYQKTGINPGKPSFVMIPNIEYNLWRKQRAIVKSVSYQKKTWLGWGQPSLHKFKIQGLFKDLLKFLLKLKGFSRTSWSGLQFKDFKDDFQEVVTLFMTTKILRPVFAHNEAH